MTGNRKFWVTMVALVGAIALGFFGKLTGDFATIATICVGAFAGANALEHKYASGKAASPTVVNNLLGERPPAAEG